MSTKDGVPLVKAMREMAVLLDASWEPGSKELLGGAERIEQLERENIELRQAIDTDRKEDVADTITVIEPEDVPLLWHLKPDLYAKHIKGTPDDPWLNCKPSEPEPLPPIEEDFGQPRWLEWQADIAEKAGNADLAKGLRLSAEWLSYDR
jgi:hypothetical protein